MRFPLPDLPPTWPPAYPRHAAVTADVSRALDRAAEADHGLPSLALMEHASRGVAAVAVALVPAHARVVVLCGPGNNGGDGYGAARFLASWGRTPRLLRCSRRTPPKGDAALEVRMAAAEVDPEDAWTEPALLGRALAEADLVVDALFGVGLDRDLDAPFPGWIEALNAADALRLAVDVPSGLDGDTGAPRPVAVRADVTATMGMPKRGLVAPGPGPEHAGRVVEIDIGLPGPLHRAYLA